MTFEPFYLVSNILMALMVVMIGVCLWVSRWKLAAFRFEKEVMFLCALAIGPLNMLFSDAVPVEAETFAQARTAYLSVGMLTLLLQVLFWTAFVNLRKRHLAEQAVLRAAA